MMVPSLILSEGPSHLRGIEVVDHPSGPRQCGNEAGDVAVSQLTATSQMEENEW